MSDDGRVDLADFLLARIAEDERRAKRVSDTDRMRRALYRSLEATADDVVFVAAISPARVLAECEAKRALITEVQAVELWPTEQAALGMEHALQLMAAVYADHPDYDEAWRP